MRQGNDVGTQYRSAIYTTTDEQLATAMRGPGRVPDRVQPGGLRPDHHRDRAGADFFYAEDYHQQYLDKNPFGYCPVHATGVTCNVG